MGFFGWYFLLPLLLTACWPRKLCGKSGLWRVLMVLLRLVVFSSVKVAGYLGVH